MQNKRRNGAEWMELIQTCRNSGLSDRAWCEQQGISPNTFYSAVKNLRKKSCDIPAHASHHVGEVHEIVPVSVSHDSDLSTADMPEWKSKVYPKPETHPAITLTVKGCVLEIQNTAGRDLIFHTISALQQL